MVPRKKATGSKARTCFQKEQKEKIVISGRTEKEILLHRKDTDSALKVQILSFVMVIDRENGYT